MPAATPFVVIRRLIPALLVLFITGPARADEAPVEDGLFITVANPITSGVTNRVKEMTERARQRKDRRITRIVYDFNPDGREAGSPDFGPCLDLAEYIRNLHDLTTIAYIHNKVHRHTVLPALSCRELVMAGSPDTKIGEVLPDPNEPRNPTQLDAYARAAGESRAAVVLKMLDPRIEVLEGRKNNAVFYIDRAKPAEGVVGIKPEPVLPAGRLALLSGDEAVRFGLAKLTNKDSRQQVAEAYGLSASSLKEDPLQGRAPVAWRFEVRGEINQAMFESLKRRIKKAIGQRANVFILHLECDGGSVDVAQKFADFLRNLKDDVDNAPVMTIAFIPSAAPNTATFLALACTEIVMGKDATLGDFTLWLAGGNDNPHGRNIQAVSTVLQDLAAQQGIPPVLAAGMLDPNLEIYRARTAKGSLEHRLMTAQELEEDKNLPEPKWVVENQIKHKGRPLVLTGTQAKELGVARHTVENTADKNQVYALYGLDPNKVVDGRPDWLDGIAEFLCNRYVAVLLVMIGIGCLILELKLPGVTAPGVIAAVCFVLFFWSQSRLSGEIVILAILLFLLGLALIAIEIFILPGFGFVGISGIVLMLAGLGLATVERMPHTNTDWLDFGTTLMQFGAGLVVAAIGAIVFARYLPNIPIANRMVLVPPGEHPDSVEEPPALPGVEISAALLGAIGTAATVLRPAGMARFGEQYVDVVTEGSYVPAGARVQVIEVEANRIVVKEV
ncbi:MAG: NfeD family protein [Gemmataceae bacterium]